MKYPLISLLLLLLHTSIDVVWSAGVGQCDESKCTYSAWHEVIDTVDGTEFVAEYPCQVPNGLAGCTCEPGYRAVVLNTGQLLEYHRFVKGIVQYTCCQTGEDESLIKQSVYCGDYQPLDTDNLLAAGCTKEHCTSPINYCLTNSGQVSSCAEGYRPQLTGRSSPLLIYKKYTMIYEYLCCPDSSDNNVLVLAPSLCSDEICTQADVCFEELGCFVPDNPEEYQGCVSNKCAGYNPGNSFEKGCYARLGSTCACEDGLLPKGTDRNDETNDGLFEYVCCPPGTPGAEPNCQSSSSMRLWLFVLVFNGITLCLFLCRLFLKKEQLSCCWAVWNNNRNKKTTIANGHGGDEEPSPQPRTPDAQNTEHKLLHSVSLPSDSFEMDKDDELQNAARAEMGQQLHVQGGEDDTRSPLSPPFELQSDARVPQQEFLQSVQSGMTKADDGCAPKITTVLETHQELKQQQQQQQQQQDLELFHGVSSRSQIPNMEKSTPEDATLTDLQMMHQQQQRLMHELLVLKQQMQFLIENHYDFLIQNHNSLDRNSPLSSNSRNEEIIEDLMAEKTVKFENINNPTENNILEAKFGLEVSKNQTIPDESRQLSNEIDDTDEVQTTSDQDPSANDQRAPELLDERIRMASRKDENQETSGPLDSFASGFCGVQGALSENTVLGNYSNLNQANVVVRVKGDEGKRRESVSPTRGGVIQNIIYGGIGDEDSDELGGIHQWCLYHLTKKPSRNHKIWFTYFTMVLSALASWFFLLCQCLVLYLLVLETAAPRCQISDCREGTTCDQERVVCVDVFFYQSCPYLDKLSPLPLASMLTVAFIFLYIAHGVIRDLGQNFQLCKAAKYRYRISKDSRHYMMNKFVVFNIWCMYYIRGYLLPTLIFSASVAIFYAEDDGFTVAKIVLNGIAIVFLVEFHNVVHDLLLTPSTQKKVNAEMQWAYKQVVDLSIREARQQLVAGRKDREVYIWWIHRIMCICFSGLSLAIVNDPIRMSSAVFNNSNCDAIFILVTLLLFVGICFAALDNFVQDSPLSCKSGLLNIFFSQIFLVVVYSCVLTPLAVVIYLGAGGMPWFQEELRGLG